MTAAGEPADPEGMPGPDSAPATLDDLRGLRRWVVAAGAWAVAASAIALIALFSADDGSRRSEQGTNPAQLAELSEQLEGLERRTDKAVAAAQGAEDSAADLGGQVDQLDTRLTSLEEGDDEPGGLDELSGRVDELEQRVNSLDQEPPPGE